ncbi:MAG: ferredoxin, partial [Myxococcota bacterium]
MNWVDEIRASLGKAGLNVFGVADGRGLDHILPGCRSVVVFASGGTALWEAMCVNLSAHPAHLTDEDHPLDAFVARSIAAADPTPPASRRWVRCAAQPEAFVDFRPLAHGAGMGWTSRLGLLLHPEFGPWLGLRAACFTTEALPVSGPVSGENPCDACPGHCASACPGGVLSEGPLNIRQCAAFHLTSDACHGRCHARLACPVGARHRHGTLQHHYHNERIDGRGLLAEALGITDDARSGVGPHWA